MYPQSHLNFGIISMINIVTVSSLFAIIIKITKMTKRAIIQFYSNPSNLSKPFFLLAKNAITAMSFEWYKKLYTCAFTENLSSILFLIHKYLSITLRPASTLVKVLLCLNNFHERVSGFAPAMCFSHTIFLCLMHNSESSKILVKSKPGAI